MKKITFLITSLILTLFLISCSSNNDIANKSIRELRIGLKEAKIYHCFYSDDKIENKVLCEIYTFDKDGNIATSNSYDEEGRGVGYKTVYTYNHAYMIIESTDYDKDGNKVAFESIKYYQGDTVMSEKFSEVYDEDGTINKHEYKYDDKGHETYCASYIKGILEWEWFTENIYNDRNRLIKAIKTMKNATNNRISTPDVIDFLDENGNLFDSNVSGTEKIFNKLGQLIEEKVPHTGETIKYVYNKRGLIEEQVMYDEKGIPTIGTITEYK
jgi:hypothetical protein